MQKPSSIMLPPVISTQTPRSPSPKAAIQVSMEVNVSNYASLAGKAGTIVADPTFNALQRDAVRTSPATGSIQDERTCVIPGSHGTIGTGRNPVRTQCVLGGWSGRCRQRISTKMRCF